MKRLNGLKKKASELVRLVRVGKGVINPARLKAIVNNLPVDTGLQKRVADAVILGDLDAHKTDLLSQAVAAVQEELDTVEIICTQPAVAASVLEIIPNTPNRTPLLKDILVVSNYHELNDNETVQLAKEVVKIDNEEDKDRLYEDPKGYFREHQILIPQKELYSEGVNPHENLDHHIGVLDKSLGSLEQNTDTAKIMNKTDHQIEALIKSGLQRYLFHLRESLDQWIDKTIY